MAGLASTPTRARPAMGAATVNTPLREDAPAAVDVRDVSRRFGAKLALDRISLRLEPGSIHALLGPNGAGKTTLLRILSGLLAADSGVVRLMGVDVTTNPRQLRGRVGLVPAGDRTFYLRLTALENLAFFARLQGLRKKDAYDAARHSLVAVGLGEAACTRVAAYSHGMQKRLSVARALLPHPPVLLVDEATHDLDPDGAVQVRRLVAAAAADGAAVVWATQRLDEIRGFAQTVTLIDRGCMRFAGSVTELTQFAEPRHYALQLTTTSGNMKGLEARARATLGDIATCRLFADGSADTCHLMLAAGVGIGSAVARLEHAGMQVVSCRQERSDIEEAFLALTTRESA